MRLHPVHRSIVLLDIEGFSRPVRGDLERCKLRTALYEVLGEALTEAGVDRARCRIEDRGDGVMILVDPSVPKDLLVGSLVRELCTCLRHHNRGAAEAMRIRLRVAVHAGELLDDPNGVAGQALNVAFRLLEDDHLRARLGDTRGDLALIVSELVFDAIVRNRFGDLEPDDYQRVEVRVKETRVPAWICTPGERPPHPQTAIAKPAPGTASDPAQGGSREAVRTPPGQAAPWIVGELDLEQVEGEVTVVDAGDVESGTVKGKGRAKTVARGGSYTGVRAGNIGRQAAGGSER